MNRIVIGNWNLWTGKKMKRKRRRRDRDRERTLTHTNRVKLKFYCFATVLLLFCKWNAMIIENKNENANANTHTVLKMVEQLECFEQFGCSATRRVYRKAGQEEDGRFMYSALINANARSQRHTQANRWIERKCKFHFSVVCRFSYTLPYPKAILYVGFVSSVFRFLVLTYTLTICTTQYTHKQ